MVNRKIPKIRFRHFSDDWKSDKLGKLGTVAMNKRIFKEETSEVVKNLRNINLNIHILKLEIF